MPPILLGISKRNLSNFSDATTAFRNPLSVQNSSYVERNVGTQLREFPEKSIVLSAHLKECS